MPAHWPLKKMDTVYYRESHRAAARNPCAASLPHGKCCALLNSALISGLSRTVQDKLLCIGTLQQWEKSDYLFSDGIRVERFYYLFSGKVREYYLNDSGEEILRSVILPDNYISLHIAFSKSRIYPYYGEALTESTTYSWPVGEFLDILNQVPELGLQTAAALSETVELTCRQNCLCKKPRSAQRVAGYLLSKQQDFCPEYSGYDRANCCEMIDVRPLGVAAQELCLSRETFTRILSTFQKKNIIRNNKGVITILDTDSLKDIYGTI